MHTPPQPQTPPDTSPPLSSASDHPTSPGALREQRLFLAWRSGDERAGTVLFRCLRTKLLHYFRSLPRDVAEDLTQETLVACVRGRVSLRDVRALRRYVYTVAHRMLARERARRSIIALPFDESKLPAGPRGRLNTERLDVEHLLGTAPHRQLIAEYYIDGLRAPELARRRCMPLGTIRSQLRRGLLQLRRSVATSRCRGTSPPPTAQRRSQFEQPIAQVVQFAP